jgi:hypothetical protein
MFYKNGTAVFAKLSKDGTSAWGMVAEKVWAKVNGNYLKANGFFPDTVIKNFFAGSPYFFDFVNNSTSTTIFKLLNASVSADYLLEAKAGSDKCNIASFLISY